MKRIYCLPYASLILAGAALLVAIWPSVTLRLQYDRLYIATGELWRFLTSHWTHVSGDHLFWDVLLFVVLGALCESNSRVRYAVCIAGAAVLIPLMLWVAFPDLQTYRGLSGIDSALFALLATVLLQQEWRAQRWEWVGPLTVICLAFFAKVGYEWATGHTIFVDSRAGDMIPVPLAHGVGAGVGVVVGLVRFPKMPACLYTSLRTFRHTTCPES